MSNSQLSRKFIGNPFQGAKYSHYVGLDMTGLRTTMGREGVFVHHSEEPLNLLDRVVDYGQNEI